MLLTSRADSQKKTLSTHGFLPDKKLTDEVVKFGKIVYTSKSHGIVLAKNCGAFARLVLGNRLI